MVQRNSWPFVDLHFYEPLHLQWRQLFSLLMPARQRVRGILIYPCPSVRPSVEEVLCGVVFLSISTLSGCFRMWGRPHKCTKKICSNDHCGVACSYRFQLQNVIVQTYGHHSCQLTRFSHVIHAFLPVYTCCFLHMPGTRFPKLHTRLHTFL